VRAAAEADTMSDTGDAGAGAGAASSGPTNAGAGGGPASARSGTEPEAVAAPAGASGGKAFNAASATRGDGGDGQHGVGDGAGAAAATAAASAPAQATSGHEDDVHDHDDVHVDDQDFEQALQDALALDEMDGMGADTGGADIDGDMDGAGDVDGNASDEELMNALQEFTLGDDVDDVGTYIVVFCVCCAHCSTQCGVRTHVCFMCVCWWCHVTVTVCVCVRCVFCARRWVCVGFRVLSCVLRP